MRDFAHEIHVLGMPWAGPGKSTEDRIGQVARTSAECGAAPLMLPVRIGITAEGTGCNVLAPCGSKSGLRYVMRSMQGDYMRSRCRGHFVPLLRSFFGSRACLTPRHSTQGFGCFSVSAPKEGPLLGTPTFAEAVSDQIFAVFRGSEEATMGARSERDVIGFPTLGIARIYFDVGVLVSPPPGADLGKPLALHPAPEQRDGPVQGGEDEERLLKAYAETRAGGVTHKESAEGAACSQGVGFPCTLSNGVLQRTDVLQAGKPRPTITNSHGKTGTLSKEKALTPSDRQGRSLIGRAWRHEMDLLNLSENEGKADFAATGGVKNQRQLKLMLLSTNTRGKVKDRPKILGTQLQLTRRHSGPSPEEAKRLKTATHIINEAASTQFSRGREPRPVVQKEAVQVAGIAGEVVAEALHA